MTKKLYYIQIAFFIAGFLFSHLKIAGQPGTLDLTFNQGEGPNNDVLPIAIQPDGKILIGGYFTSYDGTSRNRIARLNPDGSLDLTFNPGTGADDGVEVITLQSDGRILIGGSFTEYNGVNRNKIARINSNGSIDNTFDPGSGMNGIVRSIAMHFEGKILVGGGFSVYNGTDAKYLTRIESDGSMDIDFNTGSGPSSSVFSIIVMNNEDIVIGGNFGAYDGTLINRVARINPDGSINENFNPGSGFNSFVETLERQSNGKIIATGDFTLFNNVERNRIARIEPGGSLDLSFNPGAGADNIIESAAIQSDGKIVVSGNFNNFNNLPFGKIVRLNANGSVDVSFDSGSGANNYVFSSVLQSDGKILIGGFFTSYNGSAVKHIARINGDNPTGINPNDEFTGSFIYPNPATSFIHIGTGAVEVDKVEIFDPAGALVISVNQPRYIDISALANGIYFARIETVAKSYSEKLLIRR